jgi:FtsP/CotA-like multicopper oxidase with cupredoxin domain
MNSSSESPNSITSPSRRRFIEYLAVGSAFFGFAPRIKAAHAEQRVSKPEILSGTEFKLIIAETRVNYSGKTSKATTVNGSLPAPTLRWREGDTITIEVVNQLQEETSIHWHGIILPFEMDGVPGISFEGIAPGESFKYHFKVQQSGTYWYHSHSGMQEQSGLFGAIIIDPLIPEPYKFERDYVIILSDWTDEDPLRIFTKLKIQSDYYNYNQPTLIEFFRDWANEGLMSAVSKRHMWNQMRMSMTDLADISGHTYTYLLNGTAPKDNWTGLFQAGETVRLRFINAAAQSIFDVRIPGLQMNVVKADGQVVEPIVVDEFRIGLAENYDVIVIPQKEAYSIFAQAMDRSGFACGTLATHQGLRAVVPAPDKPEALTMSDMMGEMNHNEHDGMAMSHVGVTAHHASTEFGASVDMRVDMPRTNLDDPGVGLRNNGRKVLTYADLRSLHAPVGLRQADREIELHLTGNMERYSWSMDGVEFSQSSPVHFRQDEWLRVILVNDTMMTHPMHLHGMWCDLESPDGGFQVRKHTLMVQPAQRLSFLVHANAPGRWAWHCHLFYHMHAGMMREVVVA